MKRFDWIYQFSVTHYKFIMRDIPDPFIFREAHKRVGYARLGRIRMYGRTFIFVENFYVNNLSVVLEIFHAFNFRGTRVPTKII